MQRLISLLIVALFAASLSIGQDVSKMNVLPKSKTTAVKQDTCLGISLDGQKIYKGKRGGLYYISPKTGKKVYLPRKK
jgi:hypothetical protein